jgi:hypothetical protein
MPPAYARKLLVGLRFEWDFASVIELDHVWYEVDMTAGVRMRYQPGRGMLTVENEVRVDLSAGNVRTEQWVVMFRGENLLWLSSHRM